MNKTLKIRFVIIMAILFALIFTGCKTEPDDPAYRVWTDTITYSKFTSTFQTSLDDGYYVRWELTNSQWSQIYPSLTDEGKYTWNESQIKNWFIGRGFGNSEANKETAWLMSLNHGFVASRTGSLVYMILK